MRIESTFTLSGTVPAGTRGGSLHERLSTRAVDAMKANTAAANAPWNRAMSRASASTRPPPSIPCTITASRTPRAQKRTQRRGSKNQTAAANTMLTQPMVIPARRWPCSTNLSPADCSHGYDSIPCPSDVGQSRKAIPASSVVTSAPTTIGKRAVAAVATASQNNARR